jgi:hypothetical protein
MLQFEPWRLRTVLTGNEASAKVVQAIIMRMLRRARLIELLRGEQQDG